MWVSGGRAFQAERTVSATALGQEHVWCVGGTPWVQYGESGVIRERMVGEEIWEVTKRSDCPGLRGCRKSIAFYSVKQGPGRGF